MDGVTRRPRITPKQRHILTRIADGWKLYSDGVKYCWLDSGRFSATDSIEDVPLRTADRLVLRNLVHPSGHLLPDGWAAIGRPLAGRVACASAPDSCRTQR